MSVSLIVNGYSVSKFQACQKRSNHTFWLLIPIGVRYPTADAHVETKLDFLFPLQSVTYVNDFTVAVCWSSEKILMSSIFYIAKVLYGSRSCWTSLVTAFLSYVIEVQDTLSLAIPPCFLVLNIFQAINAIATFRFSYFLVIASKSANPVVYVILIFWCPLYKGNEKVSVHSSSTT